jgi:hypothetical protein
MQQAAVPTRDTLCAMFGPIAIEPATIEQVDRRPSPRWLGRLPGENEPPFGISRDAWRQHHGDRAVRQSERPLAKRPDEASA